MSDLAVPFPVLPPPPGDPGEYLTFFAADIPTSGFDANGNLILKLVVRPEDKYLAMPLTDVRGRHFTFTVHAPRGRRPLVADNGQLAVAQGRARSQARARARRWNQIRRKAFDGESTDE